ncbi:hypothetical protein J2Z69_002279 [Paenibacillus shirakamiensis]|uniref:DUF4190 domain-containing protein n=1 Tax=Paenibacillus shirakamiensis TaxID=1265935 RepID=A0ABS4JJS2_9BACL|nr:DUF4190 domain-containing protein [Paenibacillus shirakamiensis]MBP2001236.1 hypothetical protein [Paenibacillus shirakamiensis]
MSNFTPDSSIQNSQAISRPNSGKAIAALVLGILSIVAPYVGIVLGIIAIILGTLALKEIKRGTVQGRGLAVAGLVCGIIGTAMYTIIIIVGSIIISSLSNS